MKRIISVFVLCVFAVGAVFAGGAAEEKSSGTPTQVLKEKSSANIQKEVSSVYPFTLSVYGNADMNDIIDENDIEYVKEIIGGTREETQFADANYDGVVDEADIAHIESVIKGEETRLTLIDHEGVTVTFDVPVKTVTPLMFSPLQLIIHLKAADKITGVGNIVRGINSSRPSMALNSLALQGIPELQNLPDIGTTSDPSTETIIFLNPDAVIGTTHTSKEISSLVSKNTGIPFAYFDPDESFTRENGAYEDWRKLGLLLGEETRKRGEELIRYCDEKINLITKVTSNISEDNKQRVYLAASAKGEISVTHNLYEPINIAGGMNVAEEMMPNAVLGQVDISVEQVVAWNPDVILIHCTDSLSVDDVLSDPALQSINAVKNKRVYNTKAWFAGWDPATGLCECLYMAKLFYPEEFEDLNVEDECNKILQEFYGVPGLYDFMLDNGYDFYTWR